MEPSMRPATQLSVADSPHRSTTSYSRIPDPSASRNFTEHVFNNTPTSESEDCLFLKVFPPPPPPVLFWIYGGDFQFAGAGQPAYGGSSFTAYQDVMVVSVNYRTNVLGFPSAQELGATAQDLGLDDQRAVIDWVQRNTHVFSGSPEKVTIFVESASAFSVDALATSKKPGTRLFRAAIAQSGQASFRATPNNAFITAAWSNFTSALACPAGKGSLRCMRKISAAAIEDMVQFHSLALNPNYDHGTYIADPEQASFIFLALRHVLVRLVMLRASPWAISSKGEFRV